MQNRIQNAEVSDTTDPIAIGMIVAIGKVVIIFILKD